MTGNFNFSFDDVAVVSLASCEAPEVVTTGDVDDRLAEYYERAKVRPGLLRSLAGIRERRQWHAGTSFMDAAASPTAPRTASLRTPRVSIAFTTPTGGTLFRRGDSDSGWRRSAAC